MIMAEYCPRFSELRITHLVDTELKKSNESWFSEIIITHWSVHMDFIPPTPSQKQTTNPFNYRLSLINLVKSVRSAPPPHLVFFATLVIAYLKEYFCMNILWIIVRSAPQFSTSNNVFRGLSRQIFTKCASEDQLHFLLWRETPSRFNFRPSKQSSFYVFGVFVDSRGRGPLINVFLRDYFDVCRQSVRFNFPRSKHSSFFLGTEI